MRSSCLVALALAVGAQNISAKSVKIRGFVTSVTSSTAFEIEDYRITREQAISLELDRDETDEKFDFRPEDVTVGTEVEIKGDYNEQTGELKASNIKVFLADAKKVKREALVENACRLERTGDGRWSGLIVADGQRVHVTEQTEVVLRPNRSERKTLDKARSDARKAKKPAVEIDDDEQVIPFNGQIEANTFAKYEGYRQRDGPISALKLELRRNELEPGEERMWKDLTPKVKAAKLTSGKPGELQIRRVGKFKLVSSEEAQKYVQDLGARLIPAAQRNLPDGHRDKIPFHFFLVQSKQVNAFAVPNGTIVVFAGMFDVLENEAQLASVMAHEIAHATQEHTRRQLEYHKKKRFALRLAAIAAQAYGAYAVSDVLALIEGAIRNGYSRSLENQADRLGVEYMLAANYDVRAAPRVWKVIAQKHGDAPTNFFWSSHDNHTTRRSYLMAELKNNYPDVKFDGLQTNTDTFQSVRQLALSPTVKHKVKVR